MMRAMLRMPTFRYRSLRGFEKFCEGRPVEEMPRITPRICGVCPAAHHLASTKATDAVYHVDPPPAAKKLRELFYCAHMIHSHIAHFYALAAPDFVLGPTSDPAERNILGVVAKVGLRHWRRGDKTPGLCPGYSSRYRRQSNPPGLRSARRHEQGNHRRRAKRLRGKG